MLERINGILSGLFLPMLLLAAGLFYAVRLRFFHLVKPLAVIKVLTKKSRGGVSPFRSLTLALAGTLGVGNIVGVASAIALGGAGAVFWMWVSSFAAMLLKYAEVVLGVRYRKRVNGIHRGGAPYYIKEGLKKRGFSTLGGAAAVSFAVLCLLQSLTTGCSIQSAAVASALEGVMRIPAGLCGLLLATVCAVLLVKGSDTVMRVTEVLVPVMCGGFLFLSLWCMAARPSEVLPALWRIFREAFCPRGAAAGVGGFFLSSAIRFGTMRGLLSNEAGCGTSPFAHAAADTDSPVEQGFWGIFEVFVDTVLLCTVTAVVILMNFEVASAYAEQPMMMAIRAYSAAFGGVWKGIVEGFLGGSILCFGFATLICWAQYGVACVDFLTPKKVPRFLYISLFSVAIYWGAVAAQSFVWSVADLVIALMMLLHVPILCLLGGEVFGETADYFGWRRKNFR